LVKKRRVSFEKKESRSTRLFFFGGIVARVFGLYSTVIHRLDKKIDSRKSFGTLSIFLSSPWIAVRFSSKEQTNPLVPTPKDKVLLKDHSYLQPCLSKMNQPKFSQKVIKPMNHLQINANQMIPRITRKDTQLLKEL
jgi:hypothetical protein